MKKGMGLAAKMAAVAEVWKKDETPTMQFMALLLDLNRHAGRGRTDRADESSPPPPKDGWIGRSGVSEREREREKRRIPLSHHHTRI